MNGSGFTVLIIANVYLRIGLKNLKRRLLSESV